MDKNLSPIHPGETLLEDFMKPLGLTQYRLAQDLGVTPIRISQIVHGERSISVDTAMRLARYFGTSAAVWLRLQVRYDLEVAERGGQTHQSGSQSSSTATCSLLTIMETRNV
jgi:antitoxin HigA-1